MKNLPTNFAKELKGWRGKRVEGKAKLNQIRTLRRIIQEALDPLPLCSVYVPQCQVKTIREIRGQSFCRQLLPIVYAQSRVNRVRSRHKVFKENCGMKEKFGRRDQENPESRHPSKEVIEWVPF